MVQFLNLVPWAGLYFCHKPNAVIELDEATAVAREKLGLGKLLVARPPEPEPTPEPVKKTRAKAKAAPKEA